MTLPIRPVSLILIYCFVISTAAQTRLSVPQNIPVAGATNPSLIEKAYEFLSTSFSNTTEDEQDAKDNESGLRFRLSEAPEQSETRVTNRVAFATVLSGPETESILKRLSPMKEEATDEATFSVREKSLPPPRTGRTIEQAFPPPVSLALTDEKSSGPVEVVRFSPEGDVPIAPNLSVTFSQPMVAVSSQDEAAQNVPVRITPEPTGHWRWIGSRTLLFEPDVRFPMATQYSVNVPAGTKSVNGGSLAVAKTWTFSTPPPVVKQTYPAANSTQARDTLMFVEFDQRIDPGAVLKTVSVMAGQKRLATRLATREEIEADEPVRDLVKRAEKDRWLVFRAIGVNGDTKRALPVDTGITISIGRGTPSVEGPLTTKDPQTISFRTFGSLHFTRKRCGWAESQVCTPYDVWNLEFTNKLKAEDFQESQVRIDPAIPGIRVSLWENTITLEGIKKPNTTYRVTIDKFLQDQFGQTLGEDKTVDFQVAAMPPWLGLSTHSFVVLDPAGPRQLSLYSVNYTTVKVSVFSVGPEDWIRYQTYRQLHSRGPNDAAARKAVLPGRLVYSRQIDFKQAPNDMIETAIDLTPALKNGLGQAIVSVESITPASDVYHNPLLAWVQSTQIGLDAFVDNDELIGWASSLQDGAPLGDVQLEILPARVAGVTGADGLAHLKLQPQSKPEVGLLVARRGDDVAILPENPDAWWSATGSWSHKPLTDELRWYVFDDRRLYRPGEEVHLKGWIRRMGVAKGGDIGFVGDSVRRITFVVKDEADNEVSKGVLVTNPLGGFDTSFKLPATMNLGDASVELVANTVPEKLENSTYTHRFQVQEFRRPEFEVIAKTETEGPLFVGDHSDMSVSANYFAGGGLQNAEVKWNVTSRPTNYTPPNRDDYTFGKWIPWWTGESDEGETNEEDLPGRTDTAGKHRLRIDFDSVKPARPATVAAEATITDVNRQTWTSTATVLVHPANLYVGLKSDRTFVQQGEPLVVQTIVTDLDGKAIANREVKMRAVLLDWKQTKGEWKEVEVNPQDCLIQSGSDPVKCSFQSKEGGTYRVKATIHDDRGRANESEFTLWVVGGKQPPKHGVEEQEVKLIPDRKEYKGGDTAQILLQAPFFPSEATMTLRRLGIVKTERFRIDGPTYTLRIPIDAAWTPNVHVQVDLVGAEDRNAGSADGSSALSAPARTTPREAADGTSALPKRPAFASGELNLSIPPFDRRLTVTATPRDETLEPGGNSAINVEAKDASGKPVANGEVAVIVVDESVLALTGYKLSDPMAIFYSEREAATSDYHSRKNVVVAVDGADLSRPGAGGGGGNNEMETVNVTSDNSVNAGRQTLSSINGRNFNAEFGKNKAGLLTLETKSGTSEKKQIRLRENFNALAVFSPSVHTDANGRAQVQVKLPDNLTRYRVMAVAIADGKQFGSGESAITARLPLMARPSAPRFLNFGDRFELPIVLQNQTAAPMTVEVAVRASNASFAGSGRDVRAPSEGVVAGRAASYRARKRSSRNPHPRSYCQSRHRAFSNCCCLRALVRRGGSSVAGLDSGNNGSLCYLWRDRRWRDQSTGQGSGKCLSPVWRT